MARILNTLRDMQEEGPVTLDENFLQDVYWWQQFAPTYNGISLMPLTDWSEPDEIVACDACLDGCGGFNQKEYFHCRFPAFVETQEQHINALELLALIVALKLWGRAWKGSRIKLKCDNSTAVTVLNTGRTKDPFLQACLREVCFLAATCECEIRAVHISGRSNRIPDLLSRWHRSDWYKAEFHRLTANMSLCERVVPVSYFRFSHKW